MELGEIAAHVSALDESAACVIELALQKVADDTARKEKARLIKGWDGVASFCWNFPECAEKKDKRRHVRHTTKAASHLALARRR